MSLAEFGGSDDLRGRGMARGRAQAAFGLALLAMLAGGCASAPVASRPTDVPPLDHGTPPPAPAVEAVPPPVLAPAPEPYPAVAVVPALPTAQPEFTLPAEAPPPSPGSSEPAAPLDPIDPDLPGDLQVPSSIEASPVEELEQEIAAPAPEAVVATPAPEPWPVPDHAEIQAVLAEFTGPRRRSIARALERAEAYLPMIRRALAEAELPPKLAYLPMVESHYLADARSSAGAVGLWQFIDTTARSAGLRVDWWVDERLDPEMATWAAARHLRELHERFGDWELALAAYNAGPGGVARALERSGSEGFWELISGSWLRAETRRYLPKFYASARIAEDPALFGFEPAGTGVPLEYDTVQVSAPVDLYTVARIAGLQTKQLRQLNPGLKRRCTPPGEGAYPFRVPYGKGPSVVAALAGLGPEERTDFLRYKVGSGDTLWAIARRFDTRPAAIAEFNGVQDPRLLRPGQQLVVPVRRGGTALKVRRTVADRSAGTGGYRVRPGDTVAGVARLHGVTVADVLRWNGLGPEGLIRPGDRLFVGAGGGAPADELARAHVHVVERGDTLWAISRRYGVPLEDLRRANELEPEAMLRPGDELVVGVQAGSGG